MLKHNLREMPLSAQRVALAITDLDPGGAEKALVELATRLDRSRFEPVVYCLTPLPPAEAASCVPPLKQAGVEVHDLGMRSWRDLPQALARWQVLLQRQKPLLLQTFLFHANLVGRWAARRAGVRRVISGIRVAEPRRWHRWADRLTGRLVDRYVCVSHAVARFSRQQARLPQEKLVVIPNGIDLAKYPPAVDRSPPAGLPPGRRLAVCVGRLDRQKGLDWLLTAAPQWLARLPDCDLVLVGKGPEQPRLQRLARRLGIDDRVCFAGWRDDVPEILAASDLLVLPSRWEGMPNVVLEAMASHRPVLAARVEGVSELLGEEDEEQTVSWGDSQGLVAKLVRLLSDRQLAVELGEKNRRRAEEEFSIDRVVAAYQAFWSGLIGG
jgi:glycosyltransferase involved in cell wall biosynthesis